MKIITWKRKKKFKLLFVFICLSVFTYHHHNTIVDASVKLWIKKSDLNDAFSAISVQYL